MEFTYGHAERNSVESHETKSVCARRFERLLRIIYLFIKIIHISKITIIVLSYESYIKLLTRHTLQNLYIVLLNILVSFFLFVFETCIRNLNLHEENEAKYKIFLSSYMVSKPDSLKQYF